MILNCPPAPALTAIPMPTCPFKLDQVVRIVFERKQPISAPSFATLADYQTLSKWQAKISADNYTKLVPSPLFSGMVIPSSEALTTGGNDNSTINGIPEYNGEGSVTVTGQFKNLPPASKRAIDLMAQESLTGSTGISNLTIHFFNRDGYAFPRNPKTAAGNSTTIYEGVPIYNFRIGSMGSEGLNAPNINPFSFSMDANWADFLTSVKPVFDPLVDLSALTLVIVFDTIATFAAAALATPAGTGVTITTPAINPTTKFEFNIIPAGSRVGTPTSMTIKIGATTVATVDFPSDYLERSFRFTDTYGVTHPGVFTNGTVTF